MKKIENWVMPYNTEYLAWAKDAFTPTEDNNNNSNLFKHQELIINMLNNKSPYRGVLLYHGLGVGKTRTAISAAEAIKKDVVVILPASIEANFVAEVKAVKAKKNYQYIHYNGLTRKKVNDMANYQLFDNKTVIIDEVHNFISIIRNGSILGNQVYNLIRNANNSKVICLSGTPIINDPFEIAYLFNMIYGPVQRCYLNDIKDLDALKKNKRVFNIDSSKTNVGFNIYPDGFIGEDNGKSVTYNPKYTTPIPKHTIESSLLLPTVENEFRNMPEKAFEKRVRGLVSYYEYFDPKDFAKRNDIIFEHCPMTPVQYTNYANMRIVEQDNEQKSKLNKAKQNKSSGSNEKNKKKQESNLYRAYTRQICNFAFPDEIKRPYASSLAKALKDVDDNYIKVSDSDKIESKNKRFNDENYEKKLEEALKELDNPKYLSGDGLKMLSPKMDKIMENMHKVNGPVIVYSAFRNVEGLNILSKVMNYAQYEELEIEKRKGQYYIKNKDLTTPKYLIFENTNDNDKKQIILALFNSDYDLLPESIKNQLPNNWTNVRGEFIKCVMITKSGSEGITLKNVRQVHVLEPYWNMLRVRQVIGRGIRAKSHDMLPKKDRVVDVFVYLSTFPDMMKSKDDDISKRMEDKTTDEYIFDVGVRKDNENLRYEMIMKQGAIDCHLYKSLHNIKTCSKVNSNSSPIYPLEYVDFDKLNQEEEHNVISLELAPIYTKDKDGNKVIKKKGRKELYYDTRSIDKHIYYKDEYTKAIGFIHEGKLRFYEK